MGRGLSQLQRDILDALPDYRDDLHCTAAPTRVELVNLLGLDVTASNRTAVSRAVERLYRRGLILHVWGFGSRYTESKIIFSGQRTGYARATPEQVEARKAAQAVFLAKYQPA